MESLQDYYCKRNLNENDKFQYVEQLKFKKKEFIYEKIIKSAENSYLEESLDMVECVFTESEGAESGKLVRTLVEEIRSKRFYLPELDMVNVNAILKLKAE